MKLDAVSPQQDGAVSLLESCEKDVNPNSVLDSGTQQIAAEEASNPNTLQQPEPVKTVPEVENIAGIKEECRQVDAKDDIAKVKKVVRKKIVKKLVPKGSLTSKKVDAAPLQDGIAYLEKNTEKNLNLNSSLDGSSQPVTKVEEDKKLESGKSEVIMKIKEECGLMEEKDDNFESGKDGDRLEASEVKDPAMMGLSERMKKRKAEIFIGGLDRDAKEEDIRSVFGKVGEILELRMMMDGQTGKNKGYAFLRYVEPSQAKRAVAEFSKVEFKSSSAATVSGQMIILP
ncbi:nuclear polyadenylated RNA-binding protein 4-like, partial [Phalaenopsis equestris]|uniref:nuclear polyadenylated RNA-binding protein 4-like n=1 Tax=Phalaenopsis equestris TaxID=78828 RepID=UPI0009E54F56